MTFTPTHEQELAIDLAKLNTDLAVEAYAGAGKTSTLDLIARAKRKERGQYIAFNKKIVTDASAKFPRSVTCSTAHSLAFRAVGFKYRDRLDARRMTNRQAAERMGLDVDTPHLFDLDDDHAELSSAEVAGLVNATVEAFCRSAEVEIGLGHVPFVKAIDNPGERFNNDAFASKVLLLAQMVWDDLTQEDGGVFKFGHNHYLKIWHLQGPRIRADYILFDEAQDANPLMMDIVQSQAAQKIWVGDSYQAIYAWNGAVDALAKVAVENRCSLTESFRFGPEIAAEANHVLRRLDAPSDVVGAGPAGEVVDDMEHPDVMLGRTNGLVIATAMAEMAAGKKVCIQGGADHIIRFAEGAGKLMQGIASSHPDLMGFRSWYSVREYVDKEESGADLKVLVNLVDDYGVEGLVDGLKSAVQPSYADLTVSTAHKAKGAEWDNVMLLDDFPVVDDCQPADKKLIYVAATRAKKALDLGLNTLAPAKTVAPKKGAETK